MSVCQTTRSAPSVVEGAGQHGELGLGVDERPPPRPGDPGVPDREAPGRPGRSRRRRSSRRTSRPPAAGRRRTRSGSVSAAATTAPGAGEVGQRRVAQVGQHLGALLGAAERGQERGRVGQPQRVEPQARGPQRGRGEPVGVAHETSVRPAVRPRPRSPVAPAPGHDEEPAERQHRPPGLRGVGLRQPVPQRLGERRPQVLGQRVEVGPGARSPAASAAPGPAPAARAGRSSPTRRPGSRARRGRRGSRPGSATPARTSPAVCSAYGGSAATARSARWLGASKFPGTWNASQPPSARAPTSPGSSAPVPGHPLQRGVADDHVDRVRRAATSARSPRTNETRSPAYGCAAAIIAGEESTPVTRAPGHRVASPAVSAPGPHPRSTTVAGRLRPDPGEQVGEGPRRARRRRRRTPARPRSARAPPRVRRDPSRGRRSPR